MCDDDSFDDMVAYKLRAATLSRRGAMVGVATLLAACGDPSDNGAGSASGSSSGKTPAKGSAAPSGRASASTSASSAASATASGSAGPSNGPPTISAEVEITTPDGACDAYFVHPASGPAPAILIWPDIFGLRPAFKDMGKRLAESGYAVLVVNPFYRKQKAPTSVPHANMDDPATRDTLMGLAKSLTPETAATDAKALFAWLDKQAEVDKKRKAGVTGYCMGGPLVFRTAAELADRIGGAATFHGGSLVTDKPDSPHLAIPKMKARFLIAIASNDDEKQPDAKDKLKDAFGKAKLTAEVEVYAGALHGWCPPDSHVYNPEAAEKAWSRQLALFKDALV